MARSADTDPTPTGLTPPPESGESLHLFTRNSELECDDPCRLHVLVTPRKVTSPAGSPQRLIVEINSVVSNLYWTSAVKCVLLNALQLREITPFSEISASHAWTALRSAIRGICARRVRGTIYVLPGNNKKMCPRSLSSFTRLIVREQQQQLFSYVMSMIYLPRVWSPRSQSTVDTPEACRNC